MHQQRRIHLDGCQMLDQKFHELEYREKMQAILNRINRLEFEEMRAKKLSETAEKRA